MRLRPTDLTNTVTRTTVLSRDDIRLVNAAMERAGLTPRRPVGVPKKMNPDIAPSSRGELTMTPWEPTDDGAMVLAFETDIPQATLVKYLKGKFARVSIWLIYTVENKPTFREYIYKCWP